MAELEITNRKGETFRVLYDDADHAIVYQHTWCIQLRYDGRARPVTSESSGAGRYRLVTMPRVLLGLQKGSLYEVRYRNGDPLDNRRSNLQKVPRYNKYLDVPRRCCDRVV